MSLIESDRRSRLTLVGPLTALLLGAVVVVLARWGPDWPAQEFRAWVAVHEGLNVWTNRWYGGQALPGYSVLYPPLAAVLGAAATGLLAVVATAWAAAGLAPAGRVRATAFNACVGLALAENLLIGQVPFLVGAAFAVLALRLALHRGSVVTIAVCALVASLASPMAGFFLLLAAPAFAARRDWRRVAAVLPAAAGSVVSAVVADTGGYFPCKWQTAFGVLAFCATLAVAARDNRAVQTFALTYAASGLVLFLWANPVGGNISRLGKLVILPLACHYLFRSPAARRRMLSAVGLVIAIAWPAYPVASAVARGAADPSQHQAYYRGLLAFLRTQDPTTGRVEIPFTREHWEASWVASAFPLARGWERQTDLARNAVLYGDLTPAAYRRWLDRNAVSLVALPDVPFDYAGQPEQHLLAHPPSYLHLVWSDAHWRVWRVISARPIVTGSARLRRLDPARIDLRFARPGTAVVRVRAGVLWHSSTDGTCLGRTGDGWLRVTAAHAGPVRLEASIDRSLVTGGDCHA